MKDDPAPASGECTTAEVARLLGLAVRSVQLMVDRGELEAWKTPGGHRRISRSSVQRWLAGRQAGAPVPVPDAPAMTAVARRSASRRPQVLLIEDSRHFQNLVALLLRSRFPEADLHVADDGIAGLALAGKIEPEVLLVDILLPGIDGATLITGLRSHPQFARSQLIVVTSLDAAGLEPYAFALDGLPVVHKPRLALELPGQLRRALDAVARHASAP